MNTIPFIDLKKETEPLRDALQSAFDRVLDRGHYILGSEVEAFEEEFAAFLGVPGHVVSVANGTDALAIALRALGVTAGDRVATPSFTAVPTVSAICQIGAQPVFCEVDEAGLLDIERLPQRLTDDIRAVIAVHLYGNPVPMDRLRDLCNERKIPLLEDCAQAHGAQWEGRMAGTIGQIGAFSFYPTKNLGALGDGGCCFTRDQELARRMRRLRIYGFDRLSDYYAFEEGVNSRLDELQAAFLRVKLAHLSTHLQQRRQAAGHYCRALDHIKAPGLSTLSVRPAARHAYHLYVIRCTQRAALQAYLADCHISTKIHYPVPAHRMPAFAPFYDPAREPLTLSDTLAGEVLSLPLYPSLTPEAITRVTTCIRNFYEKS